MEFTFTVLKAHAEQSKRAGSRKDSDVDLDIVEFVYLKILNNFEQLTLNSRKGSKLKGSLN